MTVSGTVTVQPGRILGDRTLAIQDASGGIAVRLPTGHDGSGLARGTIVRLSGTLAAPYGNLEIRLSGADDVVVFGSGGLPQALPLDSGGLKEANEGVLATITGTLDDIDRYSSGAISLALRDDKGIARVYGHRGAARQPLRRHRWSPSVATWQGRHQGAQRRARLGASG